MIRTILCWIFFVIYTIIFGTLGVILALVSPKYAIRFAIRPWATMILKTAGVKLDVEGLEHLPDTPSVIMFNHQSAFDIFVYMAVLPIEWKAIMKKEVGHMPFIGWVAKLLGHYFVARDGSSRDTKEVKKIVEKIRSGPSVMIAPEGTRSLDGKLLPFQKGGFLIAMMAGVPVVPMVITGGLKIKPRNSRWVQSGTMQVKVLPPIYTDDLPRGRAGREELMRMVREQMETVLNEVESREAA